MDNKIIYFNLYIICELVPGSPEEPQNVNGTVMSSTKANISWEVGLSGGSRLTFRVCYLEKVGSQEQYFDTDIVNPEYGSVQSFVLTGLTPDSEYELYVTSVNEYQQGSNEAKSEVITIKTRGKI